MEEFTYIDSYSTSTVDSLLADFPWLASEVASLESNMTACPPSPAPCGIFDLCNLQEPWSPTALVEGTQEFTEEETTISFQPAELQWTPPELPIYEYEPISPCSTASSSSFHRTATSPSFSTQSSPEIGSDCRASSGYRTQSPSSCSELSSSPVHLDQSPSSSFSSSTSPCPGSSPVQQTSYHTLTGAVKASVQPQDRAQAQATTKHWSQKNSRAKKPTTTYIEMIAKSLLQSTNHRLILAGIYDYVLEHYPYYRTAEPTWRNAVRHNLSVNECFMKAGRADNGRGFYWAIHPACTDMFKKGDFRRMQARRLAQRMYNSMNPGEKSKTTASTTTTTTPAAPSPAPAYQQPTYSMTPAYGSAAYSSTTYYSSQPSYSSTHPGYAPTQDHFYQPASTYTLYQQ